MFVNFSLLWRVSADHVLLEGSLSLRISSVFHHGPCSKGVGSSLISRLMAHQTAPDMVVS